MGGGDKIISKRKVENKRENECLLLIGTENMHFQLITD